MSSSGPTVMCNACDDRSPIEVVEYLESWVENQEAAEVLYGRATEEPPISANLHNDPNCPVSPVLGIEFSSFCGYVCSVFSDIWFPYDGCFYPTSYLEPMNAKYPVPASFGRYMSFDFVYQSVITNDMNDFLKSRSPTDQEMPSIERIKGASIKVNRSGLSILLGPTVRSPFARASTLGSFLLEFDAIFEGRAPQHMAASSGAITAAEALREGITVQFLPSRGAPSPDRKTQALANSLHPNTWVCPRGGILWSPGSRTVCTTEGQPPPIDHSFLLNTSQMFSGWCDLGKSDARGDWEAELVPADSRRHLLAFLAGIKTPFSGGGGAFLDSGDLLRRLLSRHLPGRGTLDKTDLVVDIHLEWKCREGWSPSQGRMTGQWLFETPQFQRWMNEELPVLHVCGITGVGKSQLAFLAGTKTPFSGGGGAFLDSGDLLRRLLSCHLPEWKCREGWSPSQGRMNLHPIPNLLKLSWTVGSMIPLSFWYYQQTIDEHRGYDTGHPGVAISAMGSLTLGYYVLLGGGCVQLSRHASIDDVSAAMLVLIPIACCVGLLGWLGLDMSGLLVAVLPQCLSLWIACVWVCCSG